MRLAIIAITKNGTECAVKICSCMQADLYLKKKFVTADILNKFGDSCLFTDEGFSEVVEKLFNSYEGIIFVMAAGIVVRSIAPHIRDKQSDSAVVVVDEKGKFSISLLSGHIGGANKLAQEVAQVINATPVITTATDINGVTAFDELAVRNNCAIENIKNLKYISSELVNGGRVSFFSELKTMGSLSGNIDYENRKNKFAVIISNREKTDIQPENVLYLRPRNLVLGIGCKKGKTFSEINEAVLEFLSKNNRSILSVRCIASINIKKEEAGIIEYCSEVGIPFVTFAPEELKTVEQNFEGSEFVRSVTGVGNVCEASAFMESRNGRLICPKSIYNGITLALAEDEKVIIL